MGKRWFGKKSPNVEPDHYLDSQKWHLHLKTLLSNIIFFFFFFIVSTFRHLYETVTVIDPWFILYVWTEQMVNLLPAFISDISTIIRVAKFCIFTVTMVTNSRLFVSYDVT